MIDDFAWCFNQRLINMERAEAETTLTMKKNENFSLSILECEPEWISDDFNEMTKSPGSNLPLTYESIPSL